MTVLPCVWLMCLRVSFHSGSFSFSLSLCTHWRCARILYVCFVYISVAECSNKCCNWLWESSSCHAHAIWYMKTKIFQRLILIWQWIYRSGISVSTYRTSRIKTYFCLADRLAIWMWSRLNECGCRFIHRRFGGKLFPYRIRNGIRQCIPIIA